MNSIENQKIVDPDSIKNSTLKSDKNIPDTDIYDTFCFVY